MFSFFGLIPGIGCQSSWFLMQSNVLQLSLIAIHLSSAIVSRLLCYSLVDQSNAPQSIVVPPVSVNLDNPPCFLHLTQMSELDEYG